MLLKLAFFSLLGLIKKHIICFLHFCEIIEKKMWKSAGRFKRFLSIETLFQFVENVTNILLHEKSLKNKTNLCIQSIFSFISTIKHNVMLKSMQKSCLISSNEIRHQVDVINTEFLTKRLKNSLQNIKILNFKNQ